MKKILILSVLVSGCLHAADGPPQPTPELNEPANSTRVENLVEAPPVESKLVVPIRTCEATSLALQPTQRIPN